MEFVLMVGTPCFIDPPKLKLYRDLLAAAENFARNLFAEKTATPFSPILISIPLKSNRFIDSHIPVTLV